MDGFEALIRAELLVAGVPDAAILTEGNKSRTLPGFFRATKRWDLLVVSENQILAAVELKSINRSFGNNMNNRAEEAVGAAEDFRVAHREGTFRSVHRPWLGYFLLMVAAPGAKGSLHDVRIESPHVPARAEFEDMSYVERGELFCSKLVTEGLYDAAWFLTTTKDKGPAGKFNEPNNELAGRVFIDLLTGRVKALLAK